MGVPLWLLASPICVILTGDGGCSSMALASPICVYWQVMVIGTHLCMYICMYICMYVCIYVYTHGAISCVLSTYHFSLSVNECL